MQKRLIIFVITIALLSCKISKDTSSKKKKTNKNQWNLEALHQKAQDHFDSTKWDSALYQQDVETYKKYPEVFKSYPLIKTPFPVATYDYAVSYKPFTIQLKQKKLIGIRIGECEDEDCEKITDKLSLLLLTDDKNAEEKTLVESRNYPYLTAQGTIKSFEDTFDWVFSATPDGFSSLVINMKFFDTRFGETIIIYPQKNNSFFYQQLKISPNDYEKFEEFKNSILSNKTLQKHL